MKTNETLDFLKELAANNSKEWMDANRSWYLQVKESLLEDAAKILSGLSANQPAFSSIRPKDCLFRQNRDIRFSANKLPYKTNMAAYFAVGGKKSTGPGYYLHLEPGGSFLAGGIWMPDSDILKKIRQEIDYAGSELAGILQDPSFYDYFGEMEGEQLKTSPKGYSSEHPHIELLRYKSFIVSKKLTDADVARGHHIGLALEAFDAMRPFMGFLDKAIASSEDEGFII